MIYAFTFSLIDYLQFSNPMSSMQDLNVYLKLIQRNQKLKDIKIVNEKEFIILSPLYKIIDKIYYIQYLWFSYQYEEKQKSQLKSSLKERLPHLSSVELFNDIDALIKYIEVLGKGYYFCVVFEGQTRKRNIELICEMEEVTQVVVISMQKQLEEEKNQSFNSFFKKIHHKVKEVKSREIFFDGREKIQKHVPNFTKISNEKKTNINLTRFNLYWLKMPCNRKRAFKDFMKVVEAIPEDKDEDQVLKFEKEYNVEKIDAKKCFEFYCSDTFFYKVLNKGLRILKNPTESAYLRLPFSDMFFSIKELYSQQKEKDFRKQNLLVCYRGYRITPSEQQYFEQSKDGYFEMQGFISTSLSMDVALGHYAEKENSCLMQIYVKEENLGGPLDMGFAQISEFSSFKGEKEIIFNALNMFKIISCGYENRSYKYWLSERVQKNVFVIKLEYGTFRAIQRKIKEREGLTDYEKQTYINFHEQKYKIRQIRHQGSALSLCERYSQASEWYEKMVSDFEEMDSIPVNDKIEYQLILMEASQNKSKIEDYERAVEYLEKCQEVCVQIYQGEENERYCRILCALGVAYTHLWKKEISLQFYEKAKGILEKLKLTDTNTYLLISKGINMLNGQPPSPTKMVKKYSSSLRKMSFQFQRKDKAYIEHLLYTSYLISETKKWNTVISKCIEGLEIVQEQNLKRQFVHRQFLILLMEAYLNKFQKSKEKIKKQEEKEKFFETFNTYYENKPHVISFPMELIELRAVMELCHFIEDKAREKQILTHLITCHFKYKLHAKELRELIRQGLALSSFRKIEEKYFMIILGLYHKFKLMNHPDYIQFRKIFDAYRLKDNEYDEKQFINFYVRSLFTNPEMLNQEINFFIEKGNLPRVIDILLIVCEKRCYKTTKFADIVPKTIKKIFALRWNKDILISIQQILSELKKCQKMNEKEQIQISQIQSQIYRKMGRKSQFLEEKAKQIQIQNKILSKKYKKQIQLIQQYNVWRSMRFRTYPSELLFFIVDTLINHGQMHEAMNLMLRKVKQQKVSQYGMYIITKKMDKVLLFWMNKDNIKEGMELYRILKKNWLWDEKDEALGKIRKKIKAKIPK